MQQIGFSGHSFHFNNEAPAHAEYVQHSALAHRLTTNEEYLAFMNDGGYRRPEFWLSGGWATVQDQHWRAPLYWELADGAWQEFTLAGMAPVDPYAPVTHVSYYESDAYARWASKRLPTEAEWEVQAKVSPVSGRFVEAQHFHPYSTTVSGMQQLLGDA